jgi:hypothetical protein
MSNQIQRETIQKIVTESVGHNDVSDTVATGSFVSDPIIMPIGKRWSLNVYITGLLVTGNNPAFTIFQSNSATGSGNAPLLRGADIEIDDKVLAYKSDFKGQYMIIEYFAKGTTAGTMFFELFIEQ